MTTLEELRQKPLWRYFLALEQIPRESGNEQGVRTWLLSWAEEQGLEAFADKAGNVFIRRPAAKGFEGRGSVALQGHMDMVCVKREGSRHDFRTDPIDVMVDGSWLCAKDTSLGGDDGIAIAIAMDILTDKNLKCGPIEAIFTFSEETGMDGAFGIDGRDIRSRKLINLDSEDEGVLYIGCAGGVHTEGTMKIDRETLPLDWKTHTLTVSGGLGGHSGGEIDRERANAIQVAARLLLQMKQVMLTSFEGGTKMNVIPSSCTVGFAIPEEDEALLGERREMLSKTLSEEYALRDPALTLSIDEAPRAKSAASGRQSRNFLRALYTIPHGVHAMSRTIEGVVETSTNLAIAGMEAENFRVSLSHRSSVLSRRDLVADISGKILEAAGMTVSHGGGYPAWTPDPSSKLAAFCAKAYRDLFGEEMKITAIHAGLECGVINSRTPGMDSVSIGPGMRDVHSVDEHLSIPSSEKMLAFVKHLLTIIE